MTLERNVGRSDRITRVVVGVYLGVVSLLVPMNPYWRGFFFVVAAYALATALTRFCPLNALFGITTVDATPRHTGEPPDQGAGRLRSI
jgi:hypothetical protein